MTKWIATFMFLMMMGNQALAEYRVYQYYVRAKHKFTTDRESYQVTSTMDPITYLAYHGGGESIEVELIRSWICKGHTGNKKAVCVPPIDSVNADE